MQQQATETLSYQNHNLINREPISTCSSSQNNYHMTIDTHRVGQPATYDNYYYEAPATTAFTTTTTYQDDSHIKPCYMSNNDSNLNNIFYETSTAATTTTTAVTNQYDCYTSDSYLVQPAQQQRQSTPQETISFDLDDIGAVINGKEFNYQEQQQQQQQQQSIAVVKQEVQHETPATIYENLRSIIESGSDECSSDETPTPYLNYQIMANSNNDAAKPYVEILEQPSKCALRFRYKCEGRSAGSLPGVNSTSDDKTYPTIRINNYRGRAVVVISCVTKDAPYLAHPHNIVGKEGCKKGICTIVLNPTTDESNGDGADDSNRDHQTPSPAGKTVRSSSSSANCMIRTFSSLGIQCVKRKDIEDSLSLRESINVDPFRNGFSHKLDTSTVDLNVVRLCFQVFIEGATPNKCDIPLTPIVSDPIHDKKAMSDLVITKLSHCSAPATGGREVILLCDRISKDDIQIRFFEETREGELVWETFSDISAADVHKQVAICFRTPKYYNEEITQPVMARIQLRRISDQQVSEPRLFQFLPCESDEDIISRKRKKVEWCNRNQYALDNILLGAPQEHQQHVMQQQHPPQQQHQQYPQHMQPPQQQQRQMPMITQQQQQQQQQQ